MKLVRTLAAETDVRQESVIQKKKRRAVNVRAAGLTVALG